MQQRMGNVVWHEYIDSKCHHLLDPLLNKRNVRKRKKKDGIEGSINVQKEEKDKLEEDLKRRVEEATKNVRKKFF